MSATFQAIFLAALLAAGLLGALVLLAALRTSRRSSGTTALEAGDYDTALAAAATSGSRDEHLAAARAGKHLLALDRAAAILDGLLAADSSDGEAWLERGLVAAYQGDPGRATEMLRRAVSLRSDLGESITLHLAWVALARGDHGRAADLFREIEIPLETKLRHDLERGDPLFAEWYLHAAELWRASGNDDAADWAARTGSESAGTASRLPELIRGLSAGSTAATRMEPR